MRPFPSSTFLVSILGIVLTVAACGDDVEDQTSGGGGSGGGSNGGNAGDPCESNQDCTNGLNLYCATTDDGMCGATAKKCAEYPATCGEGTYRTVCGCDGNPHAVGPCPGETPFQIDTRENACPAQAGSFWCGDGACNVGTQYCVEGNTSVTCTDLPAECMGAQASCACLEAANMIACGCVDEAGGGIRVNGCGL